MASPYPIEIADFSGTLGSLYLVPAGQTITLTYVVAPTWDWFGL